MHPIAYAIFISIKIPGISCKDSKSSWRALIMQDNDTDTGGISSLRLGARWRHIHFISRSKAKIELNILALELPAGNEVDFTTILLKCSIDQIIGTTNRVE